MIFEHFLRNGRHKIQLDAAGKWEVRIDAGSISDTWHKFGWLEEGTESMRAKEGTDRVLCNLFLSSLFFFS
jgi:hypothetical protein